MEIIFNCNLKSISELSYIHKYIKIFIKCVSSSWSTLLVVALVRSDFKKVHVWNKNNFNQTIFLLRQKNFKVLITYYDFLSWTLILS